MGTHRDEGFAMAKDMAGIADPAEVVEAGRPDIVGDDRPGSKMIAAVKAYDFSAGHAKRNEVQLAPEPARESPADEMARRPEPQEPDDACEPDEPSMDADMNDDPEVERR